MSDGSCEIPDIKPSNRLSQLAKAIRHIHMLYDVLSLILAYVIAYVIRFDLPVVDWTTRSLVFHSNYASVYFFHAPVYWLTTLVFLFVIYSILGMYDGHISIYRTPVLWNAIVANGIVIAIIAAYLFFTKGQWHMRGFLPVVMLVNIPTTFLVRKGTNHLISVLRRRFPKLRGKVLLIGFTKDADLIYRWSIEHRLKGLEVAMRIASPSSVKEVRRSLPPLLSPEIGAVFVMDRDLSVDIIMDIVCMSAKANIATKVLFSRFLTLHNPYACPDLIDGIPVVTFSTPSFTNTDRWYRVCGAKAVAALAIVLLLPLHLLVSLLIKIDSPGPALFMQNRYGKNGKGFRMFKYRTMCCDAEDKLHTLRASNESDGALFKMRNDPRITRVGRFLRKTSIDELPQVINVLRGEMRFVGPRPLPSQDLEDYKSCWNFMRQSCSPGITCIWQVAGRSQIGFEDMCLLDIWYSLNRNWMLDLRILFRTIWVVLFGRGAY